jgi:hypothetical protein
VDEEPFDAFVPLAGAAKTESWMVCFGLSHFGQAIWVLLLITSFSYRSPQSSQTYSKIGMIVSLAYLSDYIAFGKQSDFRTSNATAPAEAEAVGECWFIMPEQQIPRLHPPTKYVGAGLGMNREAV